MWRLDVWSLSNGKYINLSDIKELRKIRAGNVLCEKYAFRFYLMMNALKVYWNTYKSLPRQSIIKYVKILAILNDSPLQAAGNGGTFKRYNWSHDQMSNILQKSIKCIFELSVIWNFHASMAIQSLYGLFEDSDQ